MMHRLARAVFNYREDTSVFAELIKSDAKNWDITESNYYVTHNPTQISITVGNGATSLKIYDGPRGNGKEWEPSYFERLIIWHSYKKHLQQKHTTHAKRKLSGNLISKVENYLDKK